MPSFIKSHLHFSNTIVTLVTYCFMTFSLSGCFSPVKVDLPKKYTLDPSLPVVAPSTYSTSTLLVSTTKAAPGLSTQRMAYKQPHQQMAYYVHHQWWAAPHRLLTPLLLRTLQNTGYFHSVVDANSTAKANTQLDSQLLAFHADYSNPTSPQFVCTLQVSWINTATGKVIAAHTIHVTEPMNQMSPVAEAAAAQRATQHVLEQVIMHIPN